MHIDNCITFTTHDGNEWNIPLEEEEQINIYNRLNKLCLDYYGKGCEELLAEARAEIEMECVKE